MENISKRPVALLAAFVVAGLVIGLWAVRAPTSFTGGLPFVGDKFPIEINVIYFVILGPIVAMLCAAGLWVLAANDRKNARVPMLYGIRFHQLGCNDGPLFDRGARDDERIGDAAAPQELLLLDILLEVRNRIDLGDERAFLGRRRRKEGAIVCGPFEQTFAWAVLDLAEHLARRHKSPVVDELVEPLPEGREGFAVVVSEQGRQRGIVEDVAHGAALTKYSSRVPTFFGFMSRYSPSCVSSMWFAWYWLKGCCQLFLA
jgi:hypothetical protein